MSIESRLAELNLELPPAPSPGGTYSPIVQADNILYVSGHPPLLPDGSMIKGKVGAELSEEEGNQAARAAGLAILASIKEHYGSLDRIEQFVKVLGMVNAAPDFTRQPQVINGFSDLMVEIFGETGRSARSAVGMGSLPGNIAVEIEAIIKVKE